MLVGKVVGSVVATRKNENLLGNKFMLVRPLKELSERVDAIVAIDYIGAGIGEIVLVATGSAARVGCGMANAPIDAAIVGIVDDAIGLSDFPKK